MSERQIKQERISVPAFLLFLPILARAVSVRKILFSLCRSHNLWQDNENKPVGRISNGLLLIFDGVDKSTMLVRKVGYFYFLGMLNCDVRGVYLTFYLDVYCNKSSKK